MTDPSDARSVDSTSDRHSGNSDLPDPVHSNFVWRTIQFFSHIVFAVYFRFGQQGRERLPVGGALLISNHQSFLDPIVLGLPLQRPISFVARDSLFRLPVIGWIMRSCYVMPIRRDAAGSVREPIRRLKHGLYVGVFPEGTRTADGTVGDFKPGFISLVRRANVDVVPVGIAGAFEAFPRTAWIPRPGKIRVVYGEPIPAEEAVRLAAKGGEEAFIERIRLEVQTLAETAAKLRK